MVGTFVCGGRGDSDHDQQRRSMMFTFEEVFGLCSIVFVAQKSFGKNKRWLQCCGSLVKNKPM